LSDEPERGWRLVLARRRPARTPLPASVRRFTRRARQRRLRAALPWLIALGVLAALGGAVAVVFETSLVGVSHIEVIGAPGDEVRVLADEVRVFAAVPSGTPLAGLDKAAVRRRVLAAPVVRDVTVLRRFPGTLVLDVTLRQAVAVVPVVDGVLLLDGTGAAFQPTRTPPPDLPVVRLAAPLPGDLTTRSALIVLAALPATIRAIMVQLEADAPTRVRLHLTGDRTVVWGDATDNQEKLRVLTTLLASDDGARPGTLDISAPSVVAVR
jgi:cell division protein FtsQ